MSQTVQQVKRDMVACAKRAYSVGLQTGNGGNLSSRVDGTDQILIKPSGYSVGECTTDNLIAVNLAGKQIIGRILYAQKNNSAWNAGHQGSGI